MPMVLAAMEMEGNQLIMQNTEMITSAHQKCSAPSKAESACAQMKLRMGPGDAVIKVLLIS